MPKFYADVVNMLIDQGWEFVPGRKSRKAKLVPPDPTKPAVTVASTPSAESGQVVFINRVRNSGAILDDAELVRIAKKDSRARLAEALLGATALEAVESNLAPVSTIGARWWAPESEPKIIPRALRPAPPPDPGDARGEHYTLGQAINMLMQGYHVKKVIQRTGWGLNHLKDKIDATGYYNFKRDLSK